MNVENLLQKYETGYQHANESELRKDILDEFLKLLDWDLNNTQSLPFYQREVIIEENLKGKFPDYSFRNTSKDLIGDPSLYFFVEAKDAGQDLYSQNHLFQAMSYGYSGTTRGGHPLVVLFNFEKLLILDCTQKPDLNNSKEFLINNKILKEWNKSEYVEKWQEIQDLLGKKAVQNGSLRKLLEEKVAGDRFVSLDQDFLADFWDWHHKLTGEIINSNSNLQFKRNNSKTATETATRILNRLIFLKVCEDRETESSGEMYKNLVDKNFENGDESWSKKKIEDDVLFGKTKDEVKKPYQEFLKLCEDFHIKYNSDLFDIDKDKKQEIIIGGEQIQPFSYYDLTIKNDIFQEIVAGLQFSPYIFSIIPVEVLGYIYEQFLAYKQKFDYETGKTLVEADKKKKTNKDEGIYYTPKEIVSFIIQATVESEKIKEIPLLRSGNEVDGVDSVSINPNNWLNKTAVDPACGSGTFLIGWYEFLHNKYLEFYSQNSGQWIEKGFIRNAGNDKFTLTLEAKKQIVTEQIFGVDMDREAVEIAKLSLCLKVLEGENNGTIDDEKLKHGEPALPTLSENIKSGNSLLDSKQGAGVLFAEAEKEYKLKPFIWSEEFEKVFENNGFDYVFANPPYISMKKFPKDQVSTIYKDFILKHYNIFTKKSDIYCCFFELALRKTNGILKNGGKIGFITSSTYFAESSFAETRKLFFENNLLYYSIPRPDIFKPRAAVNASCIGIEKVEPNQKAVDIYEGERVKNKKNELVLEHNKTAKVEKSLIQKFDVLLTKVDKKTIKILEQVSSFVPFSEICETQYGCATGDNDVWLRDKTKNISRKQWLDKNAKIFGTVRDKDGEEKVNTNLKDYYKGQHISRYYLHKTQYEVNYLPDKMKKHRTTARPGDIDDRFEKEKIVMSLIGEKMKCVFDRKNCYFDVNANILTIKKEQIEKYSYQYLAACLNSKILNFIANLFRSNISFTSSLLKKLTIPPAPLETQREIAEWVRKLTDLYEIFYTQKDTWTPETLKTEEARLVRVEYEIDKRVCELYGVEYEDL